MWNLHSNISWNVSFYVIDLLFCFFAGLTYSLGRREYGRLGLGENCTDAAKPTVIPALNDKKCVDVACGSSVSFAVTDSGKQTSF